jgi:hypothetical protein
MGIIPGVFPSLWFSTWVKNAWSKIAGRCAREMKIVGLKPKIGVKGLLRTKCDPVTAHERELTELCKRHSKLMARRAAADMALQATITYHHTVLAGVDLDEAAAAEAERRLGAAKDALAGVDDELVALSERRSRFEREAEARTLTALAGTLAAVIEDYSKASARLIAALKPVIAHLPSTAPDFMPRMMAFARDAPTAAAEMVALARDHATALVSGTAEIYRPAPSSSKPASAPPRREVYVIKPIRWCDQDELKTAARYSLVTLPAPLAEHAVQVGLAVWPDSARAKQLREAHGATWAPARVWRDCIDIEANIGPASGELVRKAGAGRQKRIGRGELASPRSLDI